MRYKVVITGCARSGTLYMAELLRAAGIHATHESVFLEDSYNDWSNQYVDVSCFAPAYEQYLFGSDHVLLHITRHPMAQINSFAAHWKHLLGDVFNDNGRSILQQIHHKVEPKLLLYRDPLEKAVAHYHFWNDLVERMIEINRGTKKYFETKHPLPEGNRFQVEKVDANLVKLIGVMCGVSVSDERVAEALEKTAKTSNPLPDYCHRDEFKHTFGDLPEHSYKTQIAEKAKRYGYDL